MSVASPPFYHSEALGCGVGDAVDAASVEAVDCFELVTDLQGLEKLEADWDALLGRMDGAGNPFLSFNWNWHWCRHFLPRGTGDRMLSLSIVVARRQGRVSMIWPLVLHRELGLAVLRFMGEPVSQYGDILVEQGGDRLSRLRSGWKYVSETLAPDALVVRKVRSDAAIAPLLQELDATATQEQQAPFADLSATPDFDAFEKRFSKKFRRNCRRQSNRLEESGELVFAVTRESDDGRRLAGDAIAMKRAWLRETGQIAPSFTDARFKAFFEDVAGAVERPVGCLISALTLDGRPIAVEVGIQRGGHYAAHIGAFEPSFAKLSPGTHQMKRTICHLIELGMKDYDLLAPESDYKAAWTDKTVVVGDYVVPCSVGGRVYAALYLKRLRPRMKNGLSAISSAANKVMSCL